MIAEVEGSPTPTQNSIKLYKSSNINGFQMYFCIISLDLQKFLIGFLRKVYESSKLLAIPRLKYNYNKCIACRTMHASFLQIFNSCTRAAIKLYNT